MAWRAPLRRSHFVARRRGPFDKLRVPSNVEGDRRPPEVCNAQLIKTLCQSPDMGKMPMPHRTTANREMRHDPPPRFWLRRPPGCETWQASEAQPQTVRCLDAIRSARLTNVRAWQAPRCGVRCAAASIRESWPLYQREDSALKT